MRFALPRLAVGISMLTLAVAGCGGASVTVSEAPGEPPQLTVPGGGAALAPDVTPTPTATATATVDANTAQATPTPEGTGDATTETAPEGTAGGGTTAPNGDDPATAVPTPAAGSGADEFEAFCAENPGAC
jgi:hypothetical protein